MPVEQVFVVPKITKDMIQPRLVDCDLRQPQMAEQLAEVPTILYFLKQRGPEQIVDIPVPRGRGSSGGEVFLVSLRDRVPQRFAVVKMTEDLVEVFKAFSQLQVQRRLAELKAEVFWVYPRDRVPRRLAELKVEVFEVFTRTESSRLCPRAKFNRVWRNR